jgi:hypothetical protein
MGCKLICPAMGEPRPAKTQLPAPGRETSLLTVTASPPTLSIRRFRTTYTSRFCPTLPPGIGGIVASRRWWPDKSSQAAGQDFEPDRPHKSLHVLGRRPKTKTLVTGLEAARGSDMPSKSVGGRKLAGGFDSRPPPQGESVRTRCDEVGLDRPSTSETIRLTRTARNLCSGSPRSYRRGGRSMARLV